MCSGVLPIIAPPEYVDISLASLVTYVEELNVIVQHPNTTMQMAHEMYLNHSFAQECAGPIFAAVAPGVATALESALLLPKLDHNSA